VIQQNFGKLPIWKLCFLLHQKIYVCVLLHVYLENWMSIVEAYHFSSYALQKVQVVEKYNQPFQPDMISAKRIFIQCMIHSR